MKNKKGYTIIELIVIIVILGAITVVGTISLSHAFDDGTETAYQNEIKYILSKAESYGNDVLEDVKDSKNGLIVTVEKLIEKEYLVPSDGNDILDPRNEKESLNNLRINIYFANDKVIAELVE